MVGSRYETIDARQYPPVIRHLDIACNPKTGNAFYPSPRATGGKVNYRKAKLICDICPHVDECLFWALETNQAFGVWGGADPGERRQMIDAGWRPHVQDVA